MAAADSAMQSTLTTTEHQHQDQEGGGSRNCGATDSTLRIAKIPCDESAPLIEEEIVLPPSDDGRRGGDVIPAHLQTAGAVVDTTPLIRMTHPAAADPRGGSVPSPESLAGLYAYAISSTSQSASSCRPNVRATRLAMACGLHSHRFMGDVWIGRLGYLPTERHGFSLSNLDLSLADAEVGSLYSPDLRSDILKEIMAQQSNETENCDGVHVPEWLGNASQRNYHDGASLAALAAAMTRADGCVEDDGSDDDDSSSSDSSSAASSMDDRTSEKETPSIPLTETTLCLHCRGPTSRLCEGCGGAYFCDGARECSTNGWSHQCLCRTWKIYVQRRNDLSSFPYFSGWQLPLLREDCFTSEATYRRFLTDQLGVMEPTHSASKTGVNARRNWWATELHGWSGGGGQSSKDANPFRRVSYLDGFALRNTDWVPKERHVTKDDVDRANATYTEHHGTSENDAMFVRTDGRGLPVLTSWEHYYRLRSIPPTSPVGLLATFPLTLYYAIQRYGAVPLVVAQMLERPLRIHVVGIEKELNFVDLFKELGYLMPENVAIDMSWVVREDMFPENIQEGHLSLQLTTNLRLTMILGTYGDSLNPNFDMDGSPDMIIGMNAGLFAYESWRHVISYLHHKQNIVGVFTDYNEHSGVNCANLGGWESANSLEVNPFRQMRAMPVYCMNLPQFSNGFVYVYNEQEMDE